MKFDDTETPLTQLPNTKALPAELRYVAIRQIEVEVDSAMHRYHRAHAEYINSRVALKFAQKYANCRKPLYRADPLDSGVFHCTRCGHTVYYP